MRARGQIVFAGYEYGYEDEYDDEYFFAEFKYGYEDEYFFVEYQYEYGYDEYEYGYEYDDEYECEYFCAEYECEYGYEEHGYEYRPACQTAALLDWPASCSDLQAWTAMSGLWACAAWTPAPYYQACVPGRETGPPKFIHSLGGIKQTKT